MSLVAPTVTGWSGFWQMNGDLLPYSMSAAQARSGSAYRIARFVHKDENRDAIGALAALIGAAAGGAALNQYRRVQPPAGPSSTVPVPTSIGDFGGSIPVETVSAINRITTAADVTELKKWFSTALLEQGITQPTVAGFTRGGNQIAGTGQF